MLSFMVILGTNCILTRVERQYGGGRIPDEISIVGALFRNVATINPFEPLVLCPNGKPDPCPDDCN